MRKQTKLVAALSATALLAVGASMTSFAKGWTEIGDGEYVYLDSDGNRVTSEWRKSGSDYYYLDENGEIAKSRLLTVNDGDTDAYYYVNSVGARMKNQWVRVENTENETVNDQEPEEFWYYLGPNGKAYRNDNSTDAYFKKYVINYNGANKIFFFDTEGRMVTGWIEYTEKDGTENVYYCNPDDPTRGFAETGWWQLEVPDDWNEDGKEYDVVEWFSFDGNGKARRGTSGKPKVWYDSGWYYSFDSNGVMLDDWYETDLATGNYVPTDSDVATALEASAFSSYYGTKQGSGWVYTDKNDDGEYNYYYLVTYKDSVKDSKGKDGANTTKNVPFNSFNNDGLMRAKAINGKIYLFDKDGIMKTGVQTLVDKTNYAKKDSWGHVSARKLDDGTYYFSNGTAGVKGQMMYGKQKVEDEGNTYYYYFDKKTGKARIDSVIDGYIYGHDGKLIVAEDGNPNSIVDLEDYDVTIYSGNTAKGTIAKGSKVIVSSNGKLKTSTNGYTWVDGEQYRVNQDKDTKVWSVETKEAYELRTGKK